MLRIAFDAKRLYNNFTGLGNYSRTLVSNLATHFPQHQYHLYSPKIKPNEETLPFLQHPHLQSHFPTTTLKAYWRTFGIKKDLRADDIQIYHGLSHEIPVGIQQTEIKSVVTIHDLIIKRYPAYFPFLDRQIYDWKFRYACKHADKIIAISESTKRDIIQYYNIAPSKIEVIYQSCHERFKQQIPTLQLEKIRLKYHLPTDFLLYVGSIIPRKNLKVIVEALAILPPDLQIPLIVIGNGGKYKKEVTQRIEQLQLSKKVQFLSIDYEDLAALYQLARMLIYPSAYEGFGLPILEALYARIPVITARNSSLPEAGGAGAHYVANISDASLANAIAQLLSDENYAQQLVKNGQQHLKKFDAQVLSEELVEVYSGLALRRQ
ncbi:MAG: glycosyltransferase family 1 protein [Bacteroidota bacterium]